jgi:hypothetical protein
MQGKKVIGELDGWGSRIFAHENSVWDSNWLPLRYSNSGNFHATALSDTHLQGQRYISWFGILNSMEDVPYIWDEAFVAFELYIVVVWVITRHSLEGRANVSEGLAASALRLAVKLEARCFYEILVTCDATCFTTQKTTVWTPYTDSHK